MNYLHVLTDAGERLALISTRKTLDLADHQRLVTYIENPAFDAEMVEYTGYLALPGKPYSQRRPPQRFRGVGVLSAHADLNALPRFEGSGAIKAECIPKQLRGEALLDYLHAATHGVTPQVKTENLKPWTAATAPRRTSSVSSDQRKHATRLRSQGISWRKVGSMLGLDHSTLRSALNGGVAGL